MCYQVSLGYDKMSISAHYQIPFGEELSWEPIFYESGFNFPQWPVISDYGQTKFSLMRWGLIPGWVSDRQKAMELRSHTLNAVSETAAEKPSFRTAMKQFPVVIPVGGFFENRHEGKSRIPYFISGKGERILSLAGIADIWKESETQSVIYSFSILTCRAEGIMAKVHNSKLRSPLVLSADKWREWLNTGVDVKDRLKLGAHPDEILQACKIKPDFNKTKTNKNQELYLQPWQEPEFPEGLF